MRKRLRFYGLNRDAVEAGGLTQLQWILAVQSSRIGVADHLEHGVPAVPLHGEGSTHMRNFVDGEYQSVVEVWPVTMADGTCTVACREGVFPRLLVEAEARRRAYE